tara:strand:- start:15 stop:278 length:264 start_codon:yes stop_codon:yes gene_type:complete
MSRPILAGTLIVATHLDSETNFFWDAARALKTIDRNVWNKMKRECKAREKQDWSPWSWLLDNKYIEKLSYRDLALDEFPILSWQEAI